MSVLTRLVLGLLIGILVAARGLSKLWQERTAVHSKRRMAMTKAVTNKFKLILLMACIVWVGKSYPTNPVEVDPGASILPDAIS